MTPECQNAYRQGYSDLYHKMHCDLPNTGTDLFSVAILGLSMLLLGICIAVYFSRRSG